MVEALSSVEEGEREDIDNAWIRIQDTQIFQEPPSMMSKGAGKSGDTGATRLVLVSDTHGSHRNVLLPDGDVLIHGGDFTRKGELSTIEDLSSWFGSVASKFSEIVCICGNHDLPFHKEFYEQHWQDFQHRNKLNPDKVRASLKNCKYLQDSSHFLADGNLMVYGSPWTPYFFGWAFNLQRGEEILEKWQQIPETMDILITHGPPLGRGDLAVPFQGKPRRTGCFDLLTLLRRFYGPRRPTGFGFFLVSTLRWMSERPTTPSHSSSSKPQPNQKTCRTPSSKRNKTISFGGSQTHVGR